MTTATGGQAIAELAERHRALYGTSEIQGRLAAIIRAGPATRLTVSDLLHVLRSARAVYFDTHVEVVSGHHTATYLRFDSIAQCSDLIDVIVGDMAAWMRRTFDAKNLTGLLTTASAAQRLAQGIAERLATVMPLRVTLTPYDSETGRIGTDVPEGAVRADESYVALNDVTTRGNCVGKLGKVISDGGARIAGMMVFARRDSGQFPLVKDLVDRYTFYYAVDLQMPQWEPADCPLCRDNKPLVSWKDMPEF